VPSAGGSSTPAAPQLTPITWPRTVNGRFLVALDPGHGGEEIGAAAFGVVERDSNLDMAQRVERFLQEAGVDVLLTRGDAGRAPGAFTGSGFSATRGDLQARVKAANAAGATAFVSLHSNGSPDTAQRGVEVYYESRREFADENLRLARHVLDGALQGLAVAGYPSRNRGVIDAACWRNNNGRCIGLFVLSPAGSPSSNTLSSASKEPTAMPAVLAELLFISNAEDAALLRSNAVRDSIARGVAAGILSYLGVAD
jgi:N-acetylmuramoyl-L-alanine amidase